MKLPPFLLDRWLQDHGHVECNLGGSAGPRWTVGEVLDLEDGSRARLFGSALTYAPSAGRSDLRAAIAAMQNVDPEQVLVVAGASEAILLVSFLAAEPGANVVVPFPGFPPYEAIPRTLGLEVRRYHLRPENGYRVDLEEIEQLIDTRTMLLLANSPHNPTGAVLSDEDIDRLHDVAAARRIPFVVDEVFHPVYHGVPTTSAARLPGVTVLGDLSKAFSLAGLRLGWIVEPDAERRAQYVNARQYFSISNTIAGEAIGEIALRHRETILGRTRQVAQANLHRLTLVISQRTSLIQWVPPMGGMTCFPALASAADTRPFCEAAAAHGVLVVPGDCFGVPNRFRLGFGTRSETFDAGLERFAAVLDAVSARA